MLKDLFNKTTVKTIIINNIILFKNFSFLSLLQVSNLAIFVVITPFLFKTLGKEFYGLVIFAQTISIYFAIFVNFGFNVTATRDVAIFKENRPKLSEIVSGVLALKVIFFLLALFLLSILVITIPSFRLHSGLLFFSMLFCLSEALFPLWYFMGIEKMKYITVINILTRIFSAILIYFFIRSSSDYYLVPLFLGMGTILGSIVGLYIVFIKHRTKFILLNTLKLYLLIKTNVPLFISNVSSQVYVYSNKIFIGSFLGMQEVAIYDVVDKIVMIIKVPIYLIGQTLFPRVSRTKDVAFVKKAMIYSVIAVTLIYIAVFTFADSLIVLITGSQNENATILLKILAVSIIPICWGLFFAELLLIPFGKLKAYTKMRTFSVTIYLLLVGILIKSGLMTLNNLAIIIVVVESFVFLFSFYLCKKHEVL